MNIQDKKIEKIEKIVLNTLQVMINILSDIKSFYKISYNRVIDDFSIVQSINIIKKKFHQLIANIIVDMNFEILS